MAIENCPKMFVNGQLVDQIKNLDRPMLDNVNKSNNSSLNEKDQDKTILNNLNNLKNQQKLDHQIIDHQNHFNHHSYANDIREYINTNLIENDLFNQTIDSDRTKRDLNYIQWTDMNDLQNEQRSIYNDNILIRTNSRIEDIKAKIKNQINFNDLIQKPSDLINNNFKNDQINNNENHSSDNTFSSNEIAPLTPIDKKNDQFRSSNQINQSKIEPIKPTTQQYSMIDFDKTKALTGIRNEKSRNF